MLFKHILGVVHFKAVGENHIAFLNTIRKSNFKIKNISIKDNEILGTIYGVNYEELCLIAKENFMEIQQLSKKGMVYKAKKYKLRIGIGLGIVLSIAIIFFLSNIILKIRVTGCEGQVYSSVINSLNQYGVNPGCFIPSIDFDELERKLVLYVDNVSWASVRNDGGTVVVNIHQSTEKPDMITTRLPCNIISTRDAQIVDVEVYSGQLMVLKGDGVKKGGLLVSGFVIDEKERALYYHSQAKIIGEYTERICIYQPYNDVKKILSNKTHKQSFIDFFNIKIPISFNEKIVGEYSESSRTNYLSFFSIKLPLGITYKTYTPYKTEKVNYNDEEAIALINEKIDIYESNFLNSCEIIEKDVATEETSDGVKIEVIYKVRGNIAEESKILIKE